MTKALYKSTKVVYNAHLKQYEVYYRNWLFWQFDSYYKYDEHAPGSYRPVHYCTKEEAEQRAIKRAADMLETVEVWRKSSFWV